MSVLGLRYMGNQGRRFLHVRFAPKVTVLLRADGNEATGNFRHDLSERWSSCQWYDRNGRGDVAMSQLAKQILGSWRMTSWTYATLETGEIKDALGPNPRGYINYAPDGRMMVLVLKQDRKTPAALVPTAEEKIALYDTMFAYAGTYSVEADRVIHNLDMSWNKAWEGTQQVRFITTDGRTLTYRSAPAKNPLDGKDCVHTVKFEKVGPPIA